jgi:hypothetical protein
MYGGEVWLKDALQPILKNLWQLGSGWTAYEHDKKQAGDWLDGAMIYCTYEPTTMYLIACVHIELCNVHHCS